MSSVIGVGGSNFNYSLYGGGAYQNNVGANKQSKGGGNILSQTIGLLPPGAAMYAAFASAVGKGENKKTGEDFPRRIIDHEIPFDPTGRYGAPIDHEIPYDPTGQYGAPIDHEIPYDPTGRYGGPIDHEIPYDPTGRYGAPIDHEIPYDPTGRYGARIDKDNGKPNKMDETAGNDAEIFDFKTGTWQSTASAGNGEYKRVGKIYR